MSILSSPASGSRCRLQPSSIDTCTCGPSSMSRIISTCHLLQLRQEVNITDQLLVTVGENHFKDRTVARHHLHGFNLTPTVSTQVHLLQKFYSDFQDFLLSIKILRHNNKIRQDTASLEARLEMHLCDIHSLLRTERQLFDTDLKLPRCRHEKSRTKWRNQTHAGCLNFSFNEFIEARRNIKQFLLDLDELFLK